MTGEARAQTLAVLADHRATRLVPLTDRLVETIEQANPGYRTSGLVPRADLWQSCHDNIGRVLELLASAVAPDGVTPDVAHDPAYDAARDTGTRRAEQGLPLDDVLRSFRMGGRLIWEDLLEHAHDALAADEVRVVGIRLWEVVDETSAQVAYSYHQHARAAVRADEQLRAELWEGVLSGRANEPGFAHEAARVLDLPVAADLLVVTGADLDPVRAEAALAPHASAWVRRTSGVVGLVALRDDDPAEALAALGRLAGGDGAVSLGVSGVVAGLAGVEGGFGAAVLALRAQESAAEPAGIASFDDRLPEALLLSSPDVAERLVEVWLGPVLRLPEPVRRSLLETLEAWVRTGGSVTRTAAAVPCHRNTVMNRLRRVGQLTGHPLLESAPPVELDLALRARRITMP